MSEQLIGRYHGDKKITFLAGDENQLSHIDYTRHLSLLG